MVNITNQDIISKAANHYNINEHVYNIVVDVNETTLSFNCESCVSVVKLYNINIEIADNVILITAIADGDKYTFGIRW